MPFTASHIAAVLPIPRSRLVGSALVIGSMVPDLPLFTSGVLDYRTTHSLAGVWTVDALVGIVAFGIWHALLAPPALDALPAKVREAVLCKTRLGLWRRLSRIRGYPSLYVSLVIGAATHGGWDAFTHHGRWGGQLVPWLADQHGPMTGHAYAQHASSLLGAIFIAWWVRGWLRSNGLRPVEVRLEPGARRAAAAVLLAGAVNALLALAPLLIANDALGYDTASFVIATSGVAGAGACAVAIAVGWHVRRLLGPAARGAYEPS